jgi:hypothetical protein
MIIFCTASKDSYITDKIIDGQFRAEDANVGRASTLDLFKLYNETTLNTSGNQNEISRLLVKFDYQKIHSLTSSKIDLNSSTFRATLKLFDMRSGNATPTNFNVVIFPLSQSFDEGVGRDTGAFNDLDATNFITASYSNGAVSPWFASGANAKGNLGAASIDIIEQANFYDGSGLSNIFGTQNFIKGTGDLSIDVTTVVSATVAGQMKNHGFRVSFSGSDESDKKTRFLKRFSSRHVLNPFIRPRVEVSFNDSIHDNHQNFLFDVSGTLFLNSYVRSSPANIVSGSALSSITGEDCLILRVRSGSFSYVTTASQHLQGTILGNGTKKYMTGVYSASFAIPSTDTTVVNFKTTLAHMVAQTGSITFDTHWNSLDGSVGYHTGSLTIKRVPRFGGNFIPQEPMIYVLNCSSEYTSEDEVRFRIFGRDLEAEQMKPVRKPIQKKPVIFDKVYYRVKDFDSGKIIIPFGQKRNITRVSTDSDGMFFDLFMDVLPIGKTYCFEFLIDNRGQKTVVQDKRAIFSIRK